MSTDSLAAILPAEMTTIRLQPIFIFQIEVKPPSIIGATPGHDRRIGEISGGRFEGERLRGKILSGGALMLVERCTRNASGRVDA